MCGIAGFFNPSRARPAHEMTAIVTAMTDAIIRRGPDDAGAWVDSETGIALGHRRLSILDLSPPPGVTTEHQRKNLDFLSQLNATHAESHPGQDDL